jgi:hypothetical protein
MNMPHAMTTISEVIEKLRINKCDNQFHMTPKGFTVNDQKYYKPADLRIVKVYRFEGMSDPSDMAVLYVIQACDGLQGFNVAPYGMYGNDEEVDGYNNFLRQVEIADHDDQLLFCIQAQYHAFIFLSLTFRNGCRSAIQEFFKWPVLK